MLSRLLIVFTMNLLLLGLICWRLWLNRNGTSIRTTLPYILLHFIISDVSSRRSLHTKLERRPLLFNHGGHIILNFGRNRILGQDDPGHRRINGIPAVTPLQMEALEMVQALGEKYQLKMVMHPGDLTFINNWGVLHSRDAFQDSESRTRYLVRMWIKNEELSWTLPRTLAAGNRKTYDDSAEEIWDILPVPRVKFNIRDRFSP